MNKIKIVYKNINQIIPYSNNPRKNASGVDAVAASIKEFGFKVPVVIGGNGEIIAGHTRVMAAKKLGIDDIPCIIADDLTEAQIKAFRIADNKTAEFSEWDKELLAVELEELSEMDFNISITGFDESEIENLMTQFNPIDLDEDEDGEEVEGNSKTVYHCPKCGFEFEV